MCEGLVLTVYDGFNGADGVRRLGPDGVQRLGADVGRRLGADGVQQLGANGVQRLGAGGVRRLGADSVQQLGADGVQWLGAAMDDGLVLTVTCSMGLVMQASLELAARGGSMPKGCSAQAGSVRSVQGTVDDSELAEMIMSRCGLALSRCGPVPGRCGPYRLKKEEHSLRQ